MKITFFFPRAVFFSILETKSAILDFILAAVWLQNEVKKRSKRGVKKKDAEKNERMMILGLPGGMRGAPGEEEEGCDIRLVTGS